MQGLTCDGCGCGLLVDDDVRYIAKIEVYAAYDVMEIGPGDLEAATPDRYRKLIEEIEGRDAEELEREVYVRFQYDLCPRCQRRYIQHPLPFSPPADR